MRLNITYKATFSMHTEQQSRVLVRSWCHRMQYFYDCWVAGGAGFAFTADIKAGYKEPAELTELVRTATKAETLQRIVVLRGILA